MYSSSHNLLHIFVCNRENRTKKITKPNLIFGGQQLLDYNTIGQD